MIAIDTNVLVRLLTRDDAAQYKACLRLFAQTRLFIPDTVLLETEWVLRAAYQLERDIICASLRSVLGLPNVQVTHGQRLAAAITWYASGLDFADAIHLMQCQEYEALKTFDAHFIKQAKGLTNCRVERP